ncbi:MAG: sigma-70 family RNA polymerase sigma factor [Phycisphaerales bacterium]|nr:MAG: sigma-70 family RNA polymerase sigma factor [Phycisphaerales bacterium]
MQQQTSVLRTTADGLDVPFVDHPELHNSKRLEALLKAAEKQVASGDPLTPEKELALFKALHGCGYALLQARRRKKHNGRSEQQLESLRKRIADHLVNENLGLVYEMRRRTRISEVDGDDLSSEGLWTLFRAVNSFDPWRGFRFSTYACRSIIRGLLALVKKKRRQSEQLIEVGDDADEAIVWRRGQEDVEQQILEERMSKLLDENLAGLTPAERLIIERRILHPPSQRPEPLHALAKMFKLSKERVRQMQIAALEKLRSAIAREGLLELAGGQPGPALIFPERKGEGRPWKCESRRSVCSPSTVAA